MTRISDDENLSGPTDKFRGKRAMRVIMLLVSVATLTGCKEQRDTEDYQAGYDEGYEDGRYDVCQSLPVNLHSLYVPHACR